MRVVCTGCGHPMALTDNWHRCPEPASVAAFRAGRWGAPPYPREFIRRNGQNHWLAQDQRTGPANRRVRPWEHGDGGYTLRTGFLSGQDLGATRHGNHGRRSTDVKSGRVFDPSMGDHRIGKADRRVYRIAGIQPLGRRANFQGRRSTDTAVAAPRAHVQRAATDRRCRDRNPGAERRHKPGVRYLDHRTPTSADRFAVRFAAELAALRDATCKDCARGVETITEKHHGETVRCHWHQASQEGYGRLSLRCRCPDALHDRLSALLRVPEPPR